MTTPTSTATATGSVDVGIAEGVATITFSHPKGNSLPATILRALADEITAAGKNRDVGVIVLQSGGTGSFCAGASFDDLKQIADAAAGKEFFMGFARIILAMKNCPKLVIVRVHGRVVGGGVGMVAAADYALALPGAQAKLSEVAIGLGPFVVGPVIERRIGSAAFSAMAIDAEWRDDKWAEAHGLYTRVCDNALAMDTILATLAQRLVGYNPDATTALKRSLWEGTEHWDRLLDERAEMSGRLVLSGHTRRAIEEFSKK
jgi:methylglutaconyl-CoA hydratase